MTKPPKRPTVFLDSGAEQGTVILNWVGTPEREFTWYAEAFHEAAQQLVQPLRADERFGLHGFPPDSFKAVPIVFMYRHAIELLMKAIIRYGSGMLPLRGMPPIDLDKVFTEHRLRVLLQRVEQVFRAYRWNWNLSVPGFTSLEEFRLIINELDAVDERSFTFRYPTKTDGKSASLLSHFRFNLFEFCDRLDPLMPILRGLAYAAEEELDEFQQQMAECPEDAEGYDGDDHYDDEF